MYTLRSAAQRGHADHGWLNTWFTFSFADYQDPNHMGFRSLRVMNDDRVAASQGFGMHPHRDMEIVTHVLEGELQHKDSLGHGAVLRPGEVQRISAGTGILHSEFNPSPTKPVHLYQIWLLPDRKGHKPDYTQKAFPLEGRIGRWQTIVSPDGRDGSLTIHQDATMHLGNLGSGQSLRHDFAADRFGWLQVMRGQARVGTQSLGEGDGLAISQEANIEVKALQDVELMLFDLT